MIDFNILYSKYSRDIYHFALFLSGNAVEAEEITAETFARALLGKTSLKSATVKGYLLTTARNLYLDSLRSTKRFNEISAELPDKAPTLEEVTIIKTELEATQAYLQTFPEIDRAALLLRGDGVSYREIATSLNISLSSAKVKVHRLRQKLVEWRTKRET